MKFLLPKQHGAWAMLIIPFWVGVAATSFEWQHIPFFTGWLFLYLSTYPMLLFFKKKRAHYYIKWSFIYIVPAILLLLIPVWLQPKIIFFGIAMLPFFFINVYYSKINKDRAFANDISAIMAFSLAGVGSGYLVTGALTSTLLTVFSCCVLFFMGSTFYVKSMIREKKNGLFKWISWIFHLFIPILWLILGEMIISIAFLPSLTRSIGFYGRTFTPKKIGIYEIINSSVFFILLVIRFI
jgi:hypothetical protein